MMEWFDLKGNQLVWTKEALEELETISYIALPEVGQTFKKGDMFIEVEASKAVYELVAPFDLEVTKAGDKEVLMEVKPL